MNELGKKKKKSQHDRELRLLKRMKPNDANLGRVRVNKLHLIYVTVQPAQGRDVGRVNGTRLILEPA